MLLLVALLFSFLITTPHEVDAERFLTGSKTFEITDYSIVKEGISTGNYIQSDNFTVGGYQWVIDFYPQGSSSSDSDYVSIFVTLMNPSNVVRAIFTHRLRAWNTFTWSTDTPTSSVVSSFSPSNNSTSWGYRNFIKRSNLENSSYLRNDTLVIKTTLWVAKGWSTGLELPLSNNTDRSTGDNNNPGNVATADVSFDNHKDQANA